MLYPNYVWITYGWYYDDEWWRVDDESYSSCSSSERAQVLTGAIALSHYPLPVDEESTMANSVCTIIVYGLMSTSHITILTSVVILLAHRYIQ